MFSTATSPVLGITVRISYGVQKLEQMFHQLALQVEDKQQNILKPNQTKQ